MADGREERQTGAVPSPFRTSGPCETTLMHVGSADRSRTQGPFWPINPANLHTCEIGSTKLAFALSAQENSSRPSFSSRPTAPARPGSSRKRPPHLTSANEGSTSPPGLTFSLWLQKETAVRVGRGCSCPLNRCLSLSALTCQNSGLLALSAFSTPTGLIEASSQLVRRPKSLG